MSLRRSVMQYGPGERDAYIRCADFRKDRSVSSICCICHITRRGGLGCDYACHTDMRKKEQDKIVIS